MKKTLVVLTMVLCLLVSALPVFATNDMIVTKEGEGLTTACSPLRLDVSANPGFKDCVYGNCFPVYLMVKYDPCHSGYVNADMVPGSNPVDKLYARVNKDAVSMGLQWWAESNVAKHVADQGYAIASPASGNVAFIDVEFANVRQVNKTNLTKMTAYAKAEQDKAAAEKVLKTADENIVKTAEAADAAKVEMDNVITKLNKDEEVAKLNLQDEDLAGLQAAITTADADEESALAKNADYDMFKTCVKKYAAAVQAAADAKTAKAEAKKTVAAADKAMKDNAEYATSEHQAFLDSAKALVVRVEKVMKDIKINHHVMINGQDHMTSEVAYVEKHQEITKAYAESFAAKTIQGMDVVLDASKTQLSSNGFYYDSITEEQTADDVVVDLYYTAAKGEKKVDAAGKTDANVAANTNGKTLPATGVAETLPLLSAALLIVAGLFVAKKH